MAMPDLPDTDPRSLRRAAMLLIVTEDGGLLLHHRDDKPEIPNPDCWAGFGGAVEDGETVEEAVRREMREETGLQIADPIFLTEAVDHEGDGRTVSLFYIVGEVRPEDIDLNEGAGVGVHRIDDLPDLKMTPFVRRAIYSHLLPLITERLAHSAPTLTGYWRSHRRTAKDSFAQTSSSRLSTAKASRCSVPSVGLPTPRSIRAAARRVAGRSPATRPARGSGTAGRRGGATRPFGMTLMLTLITGARTSARTRAGR
jgi:8-oxo-dGTP pyrophosphatase MutT (NUDIX family)